MLLPAGLLFCSVGVLMVDFLFSENDAAGYYLLKFSSVCVIGTMMFRIKIIRNKGTMLKTYNVLIFDPNR